MKIVKVSTPGGQGPAGNTVWPTTGAPSASLGQNGDFANDVADSVMYGPKANGAWPAGVSYKAQNGTNGSTTWDTSGVPSNTVGVNGDWAFDPVASVLYGPKANNVWPTPGNSFKGTTGATGVPGPRGLSTRLLAAGNFMQATNSQPVLSDGVVTQCNALETRFLPVGGGDFVITLSNKNGTGPVTYTASAQWPAGLVPEPFTWNGVASVTIPAGQEVDSDPFAGAQNIWGVAPPGTSLEVRLFLTCASGVKFEYNIQSGGGQQIGNSGSNPQTDQTGNYTFNYGGGGGAQVGISALKGAPLLASNAVVAVGDSIARGQGDSISGSSAYSDFGPIYYACGGFAANALQWANCAIVGEEASQFATSPLARRQMYMKYADKIVVMYGTNDVGYSGGAISLATLQATLIKTWWACNGLGARVIACTLLPRASASSDNYETVNGQTVYTGWGPGSVVAQCVAWMIAGCPMLNGVAVAVGTSGAIVAGQTGHPVWAVCNWTAPVEVAPQGSGQWIVNGTANYATGDGTHPSDAAAQLMGAVLRPLLLQ